jgi:ribosomal-protein-serine acetyltransferase
VFTFADHQGFQAAILRRGRIVGDMGFHAPDWDHRCTEIGYWIAESEQGRGVVTRGVEGLTEHAFSVWNMNRVELRAGVDNTSSRRVAERLGFTLEGVLRQAERVGDRYVDLAVYAMLAAEWPGPNGGG